MRLHGLPDEVADATMACSVRSGKETGFTSSRITFELLDENRNSMGTMTIGPTITDEELEQRLKFND